MDILSAMRYTALAEHGWHFPEFCRFHSRIHALRVVGPKLLRSDCKAGLVLELTIKFCPSPCVLAGAGETDEPAPESFWKKKEEASGANVIESVYS